MNDYTWVNPELKHIKRGRPKEKITARYEVIDRIRRKMAFLVLLNLIELLLIIYIFYLTLRIISG